MSKETDENKIGTDDLAWNDKYFRTLTMPDPEYDKCRFCNKNKNRFVFFCVEAQKDGATFSMMCLDCFKLELNK